MLTPREEARIRALERRQTAMENIQGGVGIMVQRTPGGVSIHAKPTKVVAGGRIAAAVVDNGGIVNELYPLWLNTRIYRSGERVVYKPSGATYHYIYECSVANTVTTPPDTTPPWTLITVVPADQGGGYPVEWDETYQYSFGDQVMHGTPFQMTVYESLMVGEGNWNAGNVPGTDPAKWEVVDVMILGLVVWPGVEDNVVATFTPYSRHVVTDVRFYLDGSTGYYSFGHSRMAYNKAGELTSDAPDDYVIWADALECVPV